MNPARAALLLALASFAPPASAFRFVPGSVTLSPAEVTVTRTITLTVEIEDDKKVGADYFETAVHPVPSALVKPLSGKVPVLSCSQTGVTRGTWVFEALAPGRVSFRVEASITGCRAYAHANLKADAGAVAIKPLPLWSQLELEPRAVAPGGEFSLRLLFRNDAPFDMDLVAPEVQADFTTSSGDITVPVGAAKVEPPTAVRNRRLVLPAGGSASITWKFRAVQGGQTRFIVTGGGMIVTSPAVTCRRDAVLALYVPEPDGTVSIGRELRLRGRLYDGGEAPALAPAVALTWSPAGAVKLAGSSADRPADVHLDSVPLEFAWRLLAVEPGELALRVTASATEGDTGRFVASSVERKVRILPPPDLDLKLALSSATQLVGSRAEFVLTVINRSKAMAQNITPIMTSQRGRGRFTPLSPVFSGISPGAKAVFRGAFIPSTAGPIEISAQVTGRGEKGGPRVRAASDVVDLLALPAARLEMFTLDGRLWNGITGEVRFRLVNPLPHPLKVTGMGLNLSGGPSGSLPQGNVRPSSLTLAPGGSATPVVRFYAPPSTKAETVMGLISVTGQVMPWRVPFTWQGSSRLMAVCAPLGDKIAMMEPTGIFRPSPDLFVALEFTLAKAGQAGLVVRSADGRTVRTLLPLEKRAAGWHTAAWDGTDDSGKPVPAASYVIRLAGPSGKPAAGQGAKPGAGDTTVWPGNAAWKDDRQLKLERP